MQTLEEKIRIGAHWLRQADSLLITAGAGMGIDSGLPDFRGHEGFWKAYPSLRSEKIGFQDIANPAAFNEAPRRAWGFYGHRLQLYRDTTPHDGFAILQNMAARMARGAFVFTSNVDGQFQKAGFEAERVVECHGSIHHLQCLTACTSAIWPAGELSVKVDPVTGLLVSDLPTCPQCGGLARPNILLFNDSTWLSARTDLQMRRFNDWLRRAGRVVVIELGAGTAIASVRNLSERQDAPLIRINPAHPQVPNSSAVGIAGGAQSTLRLLQAATNGDDQLPA